MKPSYWIVVSMILVHTSIGLADVPLTEVGPFGGWINDLTEDNVGRVLAATSFGGIYRSGDEGESWEQICRDKETFDARCIAVNSTGIIFVGSEGIGGVGFLRSTNDGDSWEVLNNSLSSRLVVDLAITATEVFACTYDDGLFRSSDNGTTFIEVSSLPALYTTDMEINDLGHLFVGVSFDAVNLYRSIDNGSSWQEADNGISYDVIEMFAEGSEIYASDGLEAYKSIDNGDNWTNLQAPTGGNAIIADANDDIYIGFGAGTGGAYRSSNGGVSWDLETGLPNRGVSSLLPTSGGSTLAGGLGQGVFRRDGSVWDEKNTGLTNTFITDIAGSSSYIFAATRHWGIHRSLDEGLTWERVSSGIPDDSWIGSIAVHPQNENFLYAGTLQGTYLSSDYGDNWELSGAPSLETFGFDANGNVFGGDYGTVWRSTNLGIDWTSTSLGHLNLVTAIGIDANNYIYAGTDGSGVYRSEDDGDSYIQINNGLASYVIKDIDPARFPDGEVPKGAVWIITLKGAYFFNSLNEWEETNMGLATPDILSGFLLLQGLPEDAVFQTISPQTVYTLNIVTCIWEETYRFESFPDMTRNYVRGGSLPEGGAGISLLYGTSGRGILLVVGTTDVNPESLPGPSAFKLSQNYPNPFNPTTGISYRIPVASFVDLAVYDILGRRVTTLMNEKKGPGAYEVTWDAATYSSGVYFYRLKAGDFTATRKLVLMR